MAILTLGLQNLRRQVNEAFPDRDKRSDGWIGDAAHQAHTSGHNPDDTTGSKPAWDGDPDSTQEVRAWDCDSDFGPGVDAQDVVDHLRRVPGLDSVIRYMIYNRRIYHSRVDFAGQPYEGAPHDEHVHFEGAWSQAADNNTTFNYRLEMIPMPLTDADIDKIADAVVDRIKTDLSYTPQGTTEVRKTVADIGLMESRRAGMETRLIAAIAAAGNPDS
jgi:hypothetical protein